MPSKIKNLAIPEAGGTFRLLTQGLHGRRHPELEIVGVPAPAVAAASKLIDYVIEAVLEAGKGKLKAEENVGIPLSIEGAPDVEPIFIAIRAAETEPVSMGFWARWGGGKNQGVLRLVDLIDEGRQTPLTAIASMMIYRANCRRAMGDLEGAIGELRAAVEVFPGDGAAGPPPPSLQTGGAEFNWQNHLAYLELAEILGSDEARIAMVGSAFSRFDWLSRKMLGATTTELSSLTSLELTALARQILDHNLAHPGIGPGPHPGMMTVASPIWIQGTEHRSVRIACLLPSGLVDTYYGERLRRTEEADGLCLAVADCLARQIHEPWRVALMTKGAREMYLGSDSQLAPIVDTSGPWHPAHMALGALLVEGARFLRAGATPDELRAAFGAGGAEGLFPSSLHEKIEALETWETLQYSNALFAGDKPLGRIGEP